MAGDQARKRQRMEQDGDARLRVCTGGEWIDSAREDDWRVRIVMVEYEMRAMKSVVASLLPSIVDTVAGLIQRHSKERAGVSQDTCAAVGASREEVEHSVMEALEKSGVLAFIRGKKQEDTVAMSSNSREQTVLDEDHTDGLEMNHAESLWHVVQDEEIDDGAVSRRRDAPKTDIDTVAVDIKLGETHRGNENSADKGSISDSTIAEFGEDVNSHPQGLVGADISLAAMCADPIGSSDGCNTSALAKDAVVPGHTTFTWNNEEHAVPKDFEIQTKDSVLQAWQKWCCGDATLSYPPLRELRARDMANKGNLRRLSDLRCAMQPIEALALERGLWTDTLTLAQASNIFDKLQGDLSLLTITEGGKERKKEITWSTALNVMRRTKRQRQQCGGSSSVVLI